jgi:hypothetical protein
LIEKTYGGHVFCGSKQCHQEVVEETALFVVGVMAFQPAPYTFLDWYQSAP